MHPKKQRQPATLKEALKGRVPDNVICKIPRAFDMIGSIGIIEIPKDIEKYEKTIACTLLEVTPNIKTIAKKLGGHTGRFRRQKVRILAGRRKKTTIHSENGIRLKVHVEDTYFSPRISNERVRIALLVKPEESILVMFSGVAPYPLVIAKNSSAKKIVGIEINPKSHKLAQESLDLNKRLKDRINLYLGDVRKIVPTLSTKFDRIVMPAPKDAESFLDMALSVSKPGTIIHCYTFCKEDDVPAVGKKIAGLCQNLGHECKEIATVRCGQVGIREYRVCVDLEIIN